MKKFIINGLAATVMAFSANAMAADFVAGKDYTVLQNPGKVDVPGKIEVREFLVWLSTLL
jgi:thiol:disulfide interchange protein DsbA